ncbi:MAG: ATP-binding cassette domain-containing protein [Thermoanaerobaculales bacterium]|nr:ATP-binding cassette domain-containing protein [Thermoanaerobaculales bacterium]
MNDAIRLNGVTKTFGTKVAVNNLDLSIPMGALWGFIGPNGAGKTTTIRMIMSILFPDKGEIQVLGKASALEAKDRIGYLPEERGVYKKMKVGAFLKYMESLKRGSGKGSRRHVRQWLERVGLEDVEHKKCEELSKGMQQKVQFICAVIHEPELLILDEPFSGLDPINMLLLRELVLEQSRRGATIIFSTHVMSQAEQLCDHVVMIHDGDKVLDESLDGIRRRFDPRTILFEPLDNEADVSSLDELPWVEKVSRSEREFAISLVPDTDPGEAIRQVAAAVPTSRIELHRPTLEDVFVRIVTQSGDPSANELSQLRAGLREDAGREVSS